jgi:diguanylate cyclase (GGDEF)-like protein
MAAPAPNPVRQPRDSLATRLVLFVFLSAFVTALVMSAIAVQATYSSLRARIDRSFPTSLERASERLGDLVGSTVVDLRQLAGEASLVEIAAGSRANGGAGLRMQRSLTESERFDALLLTDTHGSTIAAAYKPTLGGSVVESIVSSVQAPVALVGTSMVVSVLVHDRQGQPAATLRGVISARALERQLKSDRGAGGAAVYLVNDAGRVVADAPGAWAAWGFPETVIGGDPAEGVIEFRSRGGTRALAQSVALPFLAGRLVVAQPFEDAFAPVFSLLTRIILADLLIVLIFSALAIKVTRTIVRPIEGLAECARLITRGELDVSLPAATGRDEVALLTQAFNDMAERLRGNRADLEQQHMQLRKQNQELQDANEVLEQLSITDGLTRLHNHRYFQEALLREIKRVGRTKEPLAMLLVDLDDFKKLNDQYGHAAGDEILIRVAQILNETVRESDILARYGGEEFVVLATGTELEGACALAEKVRQGVGESSYVLHDETRSIVRATVSIGVAEYLGDRRSFFQAADQALYSAKGAGKDCVVAAGAQRTPIERWRCVARDSDP